MRLSVRRLLEKIAQQNKVRRVPPSDPTSQTHCINWYLARKESCISPETNENRSCKGHDEVMANHLEKI